MSIPQIISNQAITFYPAELHTGKCWYVNYYAFNPYTGRLQEKRIKLNRIVCKVTRRRFAQNLKKEINRKLESGWNPFIKAETKKQFTSLLDAIEKWKKTEYKYFDGDTFRTYDSYLARLEAYITTIDRNMSCGMFTDRLATDFMLSIKISDKIGSRTYNNNLLFYKRLFKWLKAKFYIENNPFLEIETISKKTYKKTRKALTREQLHAMIEYLEKDNPRFLAASMLMYYCLLRPDDLHELKKGNFDFENHLIKIFPESTKNSHFSFRVIPLALEPYLEVLNIPSLPDTDYIFSEKLKFSFKSGPEKIDKRYFSKYWSEKLRPAMGWGLELQFYSLKDTGITNLMSDGISPVFVSKQADHSSIEITNIYIDKSLPEGYEQIRNLAKKI